MDSTTFEDERILVRTSWEVEGNWTEAVKLLLKNDNLSSQCKNICRYVILYYKWVNFSEMWLIHKFGELSSEQSFFLVKNPNLDRRTNKREREREETGLYIKDLQKILKKKEKRALKSTQRKSNKSKQSNTPNESYLEKLQVPVSRSYNLRPRKTQ